MSLGIHPLLIDHVLDSILSHYTIERRKLLEMRLVCSQWSSIVVDYISRNFPPRTIIFSNAAGNYNERDLEKFILDFNVPSHNAIISTFSFEFNGINSNFNLQLLGSFMHIFSPLISSLKLIFQKDFDFKKGNNQDLQLQLQELCFESLKSLEFYSENENNDKGCKVLLSKILHKAPNLSSLGIKNVAISSKLKLNLSSLKLINPSEQLISIMLQDQRELHTLQIHGVGNDPQLYAIKQFKHQIRLRKLHLPDFDFEAFHNFPILSSLLELEICSDDNEDFHFLTSFPQLEILTINLTEYSADERRLKSQSNPHRPPKLKQLNLMPSLKSINIEGLSPSHKLIERISDKIPQLKSLSLCIDSRESMPTLQALFSSLPKLKGLSLNFSRKYSNIPLDSAMSGLPPFLCRHLLQERGQEQEQYVGELFDKGKNLMHIYVLPCLRDLKQLEYLEIKSQSYATVITDVSLEFAIFQMPHLQQLRIPQLNISRHYLKRLRELKKSLILC